eukprot:TRINITY_DN3230_c0_g1_i1.p1 TRINITY_DN3230_c0_g1~~TRINITY_DN3230_c0_g1_i1.p1  ORF type:complete len:75 (-),score=5.97 TRINITY_DN3230_c0_g1_i1:53-277(-)
MLGNIVLLARSSLDSLYDGMPVVYIDDWTRDITKENMLMWIRLHGPTIRSPEFRLKLTGCSGWKNKEINTAQVS